MSYKDFLLIIKKITYSYVIVLIGLIGFADANLSKYDHYKYSEAYIKDWANLPTGKYFPRKQFYEYNFIDVKGENFKKKYIDLKKVHIKDISLRVNWKEQYDKYRNTLILIRGCDEVIIEDIAIVQLDSDYRASHSIFIEDCKKVEIRNSFFAGTTFSYHIRVEGCENVFISNIEIAGFNYGNNKIRCGGGIFINNGDPKIGGKNGMVSPNPGNLKSLVIQNCYVHDRISEDDKWINHDGILIQSASDGILFNCYFENWQSGDAAIDVSHRRNDYEYRSHFFRIERNIFKNCKLVKTSGGKSNKSCKIFFANNIYVNSIIADYHKGYDVYHAHETYIMTKDSNLYVLFKLWGIDDGFTYFINCLLYVDGYALKRIIYQSGHSDKNDFVFIKPDYFVYLMKMPKSWLEDGDKRIILNWNDWRKNKKRDSHSIVSKPDNSFKNIEKEDYRLNPGSLAVRFGSDVFLGGENLRMQVNKDFLGKVRYPKPSAGAFEMYEK